MKIIEKITNSKIYKAVDVVLFVLTVFIFISVMNDRKKLKQKEKEFEEVSVLNDSTRHYIAYEGYKFANYQTAKEINKVFTKETDVEKKKFLSDVYVNLLKKQDSVDEKWVLTKKINTGLENKLKRK